MEHKKEIKTILTISDELRDYYNLVKNEFNERKRSNQYNKLF